MRGQLAFILLFLFVFLILIAFFISAFFINKILPPNTNAYTTSNTIYSYTKNFFDASFIIILFIVLATDLIYAYLNPSALRGILNIFIFLATIYLVVFLQNFMKTLNPILEANTILPNTYNVLTSSYLPALILFFIALSIILNFRKRGDTNEI